MDKYFFIHMTKQFTLGVAYAALDRLKVFAQSAYSRLEMTVGDEALLVAV